MKKHCIAPIIDGLVKSLSSRYGWLSKKFDKQGVVVSPKRRHTYSMLSIGHTICDAVDRIFYDAIIIICLLFPLTGCVTTQKKQTVAVPTTQYRSIEALPTEVAADTLTVGQFRRVCDILARNIIVQPFIARSPRPPIIAIRKLENKTGKEIDEQIFQETIRAKLIENAGGAVLFRDDVSYKDIIKERIRQGGGEINVTLTDSTTNSRGYERNKEREYESGSLSGLSGTTDKSANRNEESEMRMRQSGKAKSRIAGADYFLRGIIYQVKEPDVNHPEKGMNYFQYQFRVVDARNGIIVWEKMLDSKMAGKYTQPKEKELPPIIAPPAYPAPQPGYPPPQPGYPAPQPGYPPPVYQAPPPGQYPVQRK